MHRLVDPKRKKNGGCVAASTDFHFSYNSHYQLKPAVIDRRIEKILCKLKLDELNFH